MTILRAMDAAASLCTAGGKLPACEKGIPGHCACSLPSSAGRTCRGGGIDAFYYPLLRSGTSTSSPDCGYVSPCAKVRN
ncbi:hypothetical protein KCP77_02275 [Salmonella enterica subsp. enterica]|nr:hypothetical protein KCP77_02275 [Salmonella enterica subsp. enterica]